jgi:anti-anti-sigma factor
MRERPIFRPRNGNAVVGSAEATTEEIKIAVETIKLVGELDVTNVVELEARLEILIHTPGIRIVVDLSNIAYMDSMAWGKLARANRRAREANIEITFIWPEDPNVYKDQMNTGLLGVLKDELVRVDLVEVDPDTLG